MEDYKERLKRQLEEIDKLIAITGSNIAKSKDLPDCKIVVTKSNGHDQYYWVDRRSQKRSYIKLAEHELLKKVAQRDYEEQVNRKLQKTRKYLSDFLEKYDPAGIDEIYNKMAVSRKKLIVPVIEPDDVFIEKWKGVIYDPMPITADIELISNNGVRVRSKSELIIANMLEQQEIPYRYEYPITIRGQGTVRPDFCCLNTRTRQEFIWEHFGMMDNIAYANKNVAKINTYEQNGYYQGKNMIMTFETSQHVIGSNIIKTMIEQYLM